MIDVRFDFAAIEALKQKLSNANTALMMSIRQVWALRYRAFVRRKFAANSRGGGDWPPLAESTVRQHGGNTIILRVTGNLLSAVQTTLVQETDIPLGIRMTLGGSPISEIAGYHNEGNSRLPQRIILQPIPEEDKPKYQEDAMKVILKEANG